MAQPGGDMSAGFLEPVADQIGPSRHAAGVGFTQGFDVGVAQFPAHDAAAQKRRVADDHVGLGPFGFRAIGVQQRVPVLDAIQRLQDGVGGVRVAVAPAPLDVADPDGDAGQFGGVVVDLQPQDVVRAGLEHDLGVLEAEIAGFDAHALFQVPQGLERQVEEVARAAGGIQHAEFVQPQQEALIGLSRGLVRFGLLALADASLDEGLGGVPLA